jgi:hypothetical protein
MSRGTSVSETLLRALALWARGLNVIPVPRPDATYDGKTPIVLWGEHQSRRQTESDIRRLFDAGVASNIAIITGAISGVVVIDVDSKSAMEAAVLRLPYTPWQSRTSKGYHLYYRHPGVRIGNRVGIYLGKERHQIDVRGDGGFVIAPGSIHASGVAYVEGGDWTKSREELPCFWPGWAAPPAPWKPARAVPVAARSISDIIERARKYLARVPVPEIGAGSDATTFTNACRLIRGFDLTPGDVETLLWEWAGDRPGWTRDWIESKVRHFDERPSRSLARHRPHAVPRMWSR